MTISNNIVMCNIVNVVAKGCVGESEGHTSDIYF